MRYLYEMHFHTKESSRCAHVTAQQGVEALKDAGYSGVCITDHFHQEWLDSWGDIPYREKIQLWLTGYYSAKQFEEENFRVLLGMELRPPGGYNEFLIYGLTYPILLENPNLAEFSVKECKAFADENGLFMAQAHPFRPYMTPCSPEFIHGIEVYNGNIRHSNQNIYAKEYAKIHHLTGIAGSDFHKLEDTGRGGVWFNQLQHSSLSFAQALRNKDFYGLMVSD